VNLPQCVKQSPAKCKATSWDLHADKGSSGHLGAGWPAVLVPCLRTVSAERRRGWSAAGRGAAGGGFMGCHVCWNRGHKHA